MNGSKEERLIIKPTKSSPFLFANYMNSYNFTYQNIKKEIYKASQARFLNSILLYFVLILGCLLQISFSQNLYEIERPYLEDIYRAKYIRADNFIFMIIHYYVDYQISNFLFLILSFVLVSANRQIGYLYTIKVIMLNNFGLIIQTLLTEQRPFWNISFEKVGASTCARSFAIPDETVFGTAVLFFFVIQFLREQNNRFTGLFIAFSLVFNLLLAICLVIDGQMYIFQIFASYLYFILIEIILQNFYVKFEVWLEGFIVNKHVSRKPRFYILMLISVIIAYNLLISEVDVATRSITKIINYVGLLENVRELKRNAAAQHILR